MNRPSSSFALCLLTVSAACSLSYAQKVSVIPLIPAANWRLAETQKLGLEAVKSYGGEPAVEREYGVKGIEVRTYQLGRSRAIVVLEPASDVSAGDVMGLPVAGRGGVIRTLPGWVH